MKKDNFLAKWLEGSLSEEELQEFKKTEGYASYAKIIDRTDALATPDYNLSKEYRVLKGKLDKEALKPAPKVLKLDPVMVLFRIAAVLVLALGVYYFIDQQDTNARTDIAEYKEILLPDTSEVILNAGSSISFNKNSWDTRRALQLDGEALFKVAKGKTFDVITPHGIVSVVGTQFNVKSRENYFEVVCYEGIVNVSYKMIEKTLTIGDGLKVIDGVLTDENYHSEDQPSWIDNESNFKSVPLKFVFKELERQYGITVETETINTELRYTGAFSHEDLELALQSICIPLRLKYTVTENKIVKLYAE